MGDMGEVFRQMKEEKKARRQKSKETNTKLIQDMGFIFTSHNGGAHLIIEGPRGTVNYWPSTGRWQIHGETVKFGTRELLSYLKGEK